MVTQQDIEELKAQGYSPEQINLAIERAKQRYEQEQEQQDQEPQEDWRSKAVPSAFATSKDQNLVEQQLQLDNVLERVEHILKGDKLKFVSGNLIWTPCERPEDRILNDFGVAEVMRILAMYLNRNTILSNYDEPTINGKVYDFGCELSNLFFMKYEEFGWDTLEKRKNYPMLTRELIDTVHSAYLRALHGEERNSLRENRVIQSQNMSQPQYPININTGSQMKERSILNPMRVIKGRYY